MRSIPKFFIFSFFHFFILVAMTSCAPETELPQWLAWLKKKGVQEEVVPRIAVKVVASESAVVAQNVEFTANIEPWQRNYILPALQGARIRRILVDVSDKVKKGQLVAEMDPMQYNTAKIQAETARADYNRIRSVYNAGGVSAQQMQQARAAYQIYQQTADNIAKHVKLYSPIDGVVTAKYEEEGNLLTTNPILEVMQMDRLKVKVNVAEQYFNNVKEGTGVAVLTDLFSGEEFAASVSLVYPAIDVATRTFTVEITIPNKDGRLRPGMFARAVINMGDKKSVLVPDVAVQKQIGTNERFVYVAGKDGVASRRTVEPGRQIGDKIDILSGVKAGENVITTSFTRLNDNTLITISQ